MRKLLETALNVMTALFILGTVLVILLATGLIE